MKPDNSSSSNNKWKQLFRSASAFITKPPEASQLHTDRIRIRRCLARGTSFGLATPTRRSRMDSESESEPDSPRVSCVGQIEIARKAKEKEKKKKKASKEKVKRKKMSDEEENPEKRRWVWEKKTRKIKSTMDVKEKGAEVGMETTPYLDRMKRFASGRGSLSDFEWKMVGGEGEPSSTY